MWKRIIVTSWALLCCAGAAYASDAALAVLEPGTPEIALEKSAVHWIDRERRMDPLSLARGRSDSAASPGAHIGYTSHPAWIRVRVENRALKQKSWILTLDPPLTEEVRLYQFDESLRPVHHARFTLKGPRTNGVLNQRRPAFELNLPPGRTATLLLRVESMHNLDLHLVLATPEEAVAKNLRTQLALGIYCGIFIAILLVNLFVCAATREKSYLYYVLFVSALALQLLTLSGLLDYLMPESFNFARYLCAMSALAVILGNQFTRSFLDTRRRAPRLDLLHRAMTVAASAIGLVNLSPWFPVVSSHGGKAIDAIIGISVLAVLASAIQCVRAGFRPAIYFLVAWTALLGMTAVYFAGTYGIIPASPLTRFAVHIGSSVEMILLSLALANRFRVVKQEKQKLEAKARETDHLRSLMHIVCHDLRNPLSVIMSHAEMNVSRGNQDWSHVSKAARQQKSILDFVRTREAIESGKARFNSVPVSLHDAVESARFTFESHLARKRLELHNLTDPRLNIQADPIAFPHTVLNNLISNAIKFSPEGGKIRISAKPRGKVVELSVADEGIGMPPEILGNLFSPYAVPSRSGTHGEEGTGFGMPLVQAMVRAMGGEIQVESRDGTGTTVWLRFPPAPSRPSAEMH